MSDIGRMLKNEQPEHPYVCYSYAGSLFSNFATRFKI